MTSMNDHVHEESVIDSVSLRRTMGRFVTGVAVVTTCQDGDAHGMTINSLTSISFDPPTVLVSLTSEARTTLAVQATGNFAISILSVRQEQLAKRFAKRGEDHFDGLPLEYEHHRVPVVPGALAHIECTVTEQIPVGDHIIFLGRVIGICDRDGEPLVFHAGKFGEFAGTGKDASYWFF